MVGLADLKKHANIVKRCNMSLNDKYCYFSLTGVNTIDFLDIVNYKSWVYKTFQKMVNIRYVYIIKKLQSGNTIVRTSVGFAPLLLRFLRIKGYQIRDEDIEIFKARSIVFPDLKIKLYDFQDRMVNDWLSVGAIGVIKCPTGGGKCARLGTLMLTDKGLIKIEDLVCGITDSENIYKDCGQSNLYDSLGLLEDGITDNAKIVKNVISISGNISGNLEYGKYDISGRYDMGSSDLICLKTSMGYEISGTHEHKIIIIDNDGNIRFKKLEDITNSDYVALAINTNVFNDRLKLNFHFRKSKFSSNYHTLENVEYMNEDIARLLGYMISEGNDNTSIVMTNYDKDIQDDIVKICEKMGIDHVGLTTIYGKNDGNPVDAKVSSVVVVDFMYYLGYRKGAKNKEVPWSILQADKNSQIAFISALFDGDGTVYCGDSDDGIRTRVKVLIEYYSSSYELCRQLQIMLLNMGIISRLNVKKEVSLEYMGELRNYEKSYRLSINGGEISKFDNLIGFGLNRKQKILDECIKELESRDRWTDVIYPNIDKKLKILYERLKLMGKRGELIKTWKEDFVSCGNSTKITRRKIVSSHEYLIDYDFNKPMWAYITGERYPSKDTLEKILLILSPTNDMIEYKYLKTLSERFVFDKVKNIKNEKERVYDITVSGAHSYIGNGMVNHNTILACSVIKQIARKTLILVHTSDLLINVWNDSLIKAFGQGIMSQVGIIGGGLSDKDRVAMRLGVRNGDFDENIKKDIVIATFQTLMNKMDELTQYKFGLMIVDECIPIDSQIWTQDGIVKYEDLGYGREYKKEVFQVWSNDDNGNIVNNGYKKIKTRMKHMYKTIVETGDELVCSLDHKVLTRKSDGTEEFVEIENAKNVARSLIRPYDMRKECILARIFGYVLGDGHLGIDNGQYGGSVSGNYIDLDRMARDIRKINFPTGKIIEHESESIINTVKYGEKVVISRVWQMALNIYLTKKLVELENPIGKKTDIIFKIPDWIMDGNIDIKREFLGGYFGAEGSNPDFRGNDNNKLRRSFFVNRFSISKRSDLVESGVFVARQLEKLLSEFNVKISSITVIDSNIRKDGSISRQILSTLSNNKDNILRFLDIGYRYCYEKEKEGEIIRLYLKHITECDNERKEINNVVIDMYGKGSDSRRGIANKINRYRLNNSRDIEDAWGNKDSILKVIKKKCLIHITEGIVSDILYPHNRNGKQQIANQYRKVLRYDNWTKKVRGDFIFLDILRHEYRGYEQGYTLTVNKDHNYLVNGFSLKNCHHCPAQMFRKVNAVIRAPYKLGLSATIERLDGMSRDVFGQLGDIRSKVSIRELINRGILAEPRFQSPIIVDHDVIDSVQDSGLAGLNYSRLVKKKSAASQKKKDYVVDICKNIAARDRKFLLFTDYVNAEDVFVRDMYAESLIKEGASVAVIDQGMTSDERSSVFNFLETGDINGIVFGKLGSEGVNIPSVDVVVMANAIKSPITFTQRVGRAMRRIPGKDWCDVYEVLLDLPTEMKWSQYNFSEYQAEGFQKLTYKVE